MPGTLASRITATSNAVFAVENMFVWNVLPPCAATAVAISLIGTVSASMALVLMPAAGLMVVALFRLAARGQSLHHDFADKAAAVDGEMVDVITNMPLVWSFCGLGREYRRFDATVAREMEARRTSLLYLERLRILHAAVTIVFAIGLLGWAIVLWQHPEAACLVRRGASVGLERISFCYPNGHTVFTGLGLTFEPGQRVGLVGPSGGGKSSLLALIQRFYDLHDGRITIDGQDIARVTQESLRAAIAVVPQDLSLFHRSAMENIRYGRPDATDGEVIAAADFARCSDFIEALPRGFATIVGDRGLKLSGGQRQRIAIARAFLKDAPLLLLDEATSALDSESEEAIQEALTKLMRGRTVIAIAHRLSTVHNFDRIVVLRSGQVVQDGPPDQLMRHDGIYRNLVLQEMSRLAKHAA